MAPKINIYSKGDSIGMILSNFAFSPFEIDGIKCGSVEGFIQRLKCKCPEKQKRICARYGFEAKRAGTKKRNLEVAQTGNIWWKGKTIRFKSEEYYKIINRAIVEKFKQNRIAKHALLNTKDKILLHYTGKPESKKTSLP